MNIKRTIPLDDPDLLRVWPDLAELAAVFLHDIVEDEHGTWRWKPNALVRHLFGGACPFFAGSDYSAATKIHQWSP